MSILSKEDKYGGGDRCRMFFIIFLSLIVLAAIVFFLIKGKPNLFMFQLIEQVFGERIEKKVE